MIRKYFGEGSVPRYQRRQPPVRHKFQGFEERSQTLYEQNQSLVRQEPARS